MMARKDGAVWSGGDGLEPVVTLHSGLYNGRLLTVLPYTSRAEHTDKCLQRLQDCGIQLPVEQCRHSLPIPALLPEIHRYIFFSSRGFGIILAMILYASIWVNLYSTAQMFAPSPTWVTSIPVTLSAVIVTAIIIILLNQHQKKINANTDIRLAAANEFFMEYNVLLGISDHSQSCRNVPSLCFIYFHMWGCHQRLSQRLASMHQVMARQLLIVASACYVRLLISGQLPKAHDAGHTGVLNVTCPCQFIENTILTSGCCFACL
ncbi:transmembrane protein 268 isoform X2 [Hyperolius riggenbachi]|uniref:transmembrane protein 268 isoform X2 n=1 Tax=Hyperolius riggenbachi TaxID=752182 RepID=UPI0035A39446